MEANAPKSVMQRLKEETWDLHMLAEKGELEQHMIRGTLPKEMYVKTLGQRYFLHKTLDELLQAHRPHHPALQRVVRDSHFHTPRVVADLAFFGVDAATLEPLPASKRVMDKMREVAAKDPNLLLGMQYVMEGSTNGAKFIAKALRKAYGLEGEDGTRLLDPYGESQREQWGGFIGAMNSIIFSQEEADGLVDLARATFRFMIELDEELFARAA
ncbi:MAG: biliverdin-producing heme oxygenase [Candidatus Sumerlaeia bacterium]|nr:biliverdin-producing heme oxygenase [Candidatus Sumerlaeia bacterium]